MGQVAEVGLQELLELFEAAIVGEVNSMNFFEVQKFRTGAAFVEVVLAVLFFVFDDDDRTGVSHHHLSTQKTTSTTSNPLVWFRLCAIKQKTTALTSTLISFMKYQSN